MQARPRSASAETECRRTRAEHAIAVLERLTSADGRGRWLEFDAWLPGVEHRLAGGGDIDIIELLVVLFAIRERRFGGRSDGDEARLRQALLALRARLLGERRPARRLTERVPRWRLIRENRDVQAIHTAIFHEGTERFAAAIRHVYHAYLPRWHDPVILSCLLVVCLHTLGRELVAGTALGHALGSLIEHTLHKYLGHASPRQLARLERWLAPCGALGRVALRSMAATAYSHGTIHHACYARHYVERFGDRSVPPHFVEAARTKRQDHIDALVRTRGPQEAADIVTSGYGTSLSHPIQDALIVAPFVAFAAGATAVLLNLAGWHISGAFVGAAVVVSLLFLPASHYVHPYLHMTRRDAFDRAGWLMRRLLASRYVQHVAQSHYLHHRDASVNQNLIPGADFAFGYRTSHVSAVLALRRLETFY